MTNSRSHLLMMICIFYCTLTAKAQWGYLGGSAELQGNDVIWCVYNDFRGDTYAAGEFTNSSGKWYVAHWNRVAWSELGGTNSLFANGPIYTMTSDGAGNIYVAGRFTNSFGKQYVAKWNGTSWTELGGFNALAANGAIYCLFTGQNNDIYAAGDFTNSSGNHYVAKWDGVEWTELGGANSLAANGRIKTICCDLSNPVNIYASGDFTNGSGKYYVAKWDGNSWSELGGANGLSANNRIKSIVNDDSGNLYAAGDFTNSSGNNFVARYDGNTWSELGGLNSLAANGAIQSICWNYYDRSVYAAGHFTFINPGENYIAKWDGNSWSGVGFNFGFPSYYFGDNIESICQDQHGNIFAGGMFTGSFNSTYRIVVEWNGSDLFSLGSSAQPNWGFVEYLQSDCNGFIYATAYSSIPPFNPPRYSLYKWDKLSWSEVPNFCNWGMVKTICSDSLCNLYAAGRLFNSLDTPIITKYDGVNWSYFNAPGHTVNSLCLDPSGNLYAAGEFVDNYLAELNYVAKWDGTSWSQLFSWSQNPPYTQMPTNGPINSICSDRLGNIYAAGDFTNASGNRFVAKWDGNQWTELGGINALAANYTIKVICADSSGNIYAGGYFTDSWGVPYVAQWDGISWNQYLQVTYGVSSMCFDPLQNLLIGGGLPLRNGVVPGGYNEYTTRFSGNFLDHICSDPFANIYGSISGGANQRVVWFESYYPPGPIGIDDIQSKSSLLVYPNPAINSVIIKVEDDLIGSPYVVYDLTGALVRFGRIQSEYTTLDLKQLTGGMYLLRIGEENVRTCRIIKQ